VTTPGTTIIITRSLYRKRLAGPKDEILRRQMLLKLLAAEKAKDRQPGPSKTAKVASEY
jgi:hypothetical protein